MLFIFLLIFPTKEQDRNFLNERQLLPQSTLSNRGFPPQIIFLSKNSKPLIDKANDAKVLYYAYQVPNPLVPSPDSLRYLITQFNTETDTLYQGLKFRLSFFPSFRVTFLEEFVTNNLPLLLQQFQIKALPPDFSSNYPYLLSFLREEAAQEALS